MSNIDLNGIPGTGYLIVVCFAVVEAGIILEQCRSEVASGEKGALLCLSLSDKIFTKKDRLRFVPSFEWFASARMRASTKVSRARENRYSIRSSRPLLIPEYLPAASRGYHDGFIILFIVASDGEFNPKRIKVNNPDRSGSIRLMQFAYLLCS